MNDDKQGGAYVGGRWVSADELRQRGRQLSGAFAEARGDRPRPIVDEEDTLGKAMERARRARVAFQEMVGQTAEPDEDRLRELRDELYTAEGEVVRLKRERVRPT